MTDIEQYRQEFLDQLRFDAEHEGTEPEYQFLSQSLDNLEEMGYINDPQLLTVEIKGKRGRMMAFDAYAYDEADNGLVLVATDFSNEKDTVNSLTESKIAQICQRMENFIDECVNGSMSAYCDDSNPILQVASEIRRKIGKGLTTSEILRFKYIILSNAILSKQVKNLSRPDFLDRPVDLNIWSIERFFQTFANSNSEVIEIDTRDFGCDGIQCLKAELGPTVEYDAYMGIIPGEFLGNIYIKYGSKLLQGNIRAFLSIRGNVNKGIRRTIIDSPGSFFTYNNGIAIVARSVEFSNDGTKIIKFVDPQIINGGQTTASLANAIIKKEAKNGMGSIYVPMKLTVLNVEDEMTEEQLDKYHEITKTISECANSQNSVSSADFFSNHAFHVEMEKLSHRVMAPPAAGSPFQTVWFYERSRGKYEQEQFKMTDAQKKRFQEQHPKNQVIKKELLAKCLNSIDMRPHDVCQSSAINFSRFAKIIEAEYENGAHNINEEYFKKAVCAVIIFQQLDKAISKSDWYATGGDKAQITPYAIAKLMSLLPKDMDIDWKAIWMKQSLYPALLAELLQIAEMAQDFFIKETNGGLVRSYARKESGWKAFKAVPYKLSDSLLSRLVPKVETKVVEEAARRVHKFNASIDASVEIFKLGKDYWLKVFADLDKESLIPYGDLEFIKQVANYTGRGSLLTPAQYKKLVKIVTAAEDKGYIMP